EEDKMGRVYFDVYPKEAKLYIDSKLVDSSELIELTIGSHKVEAVMEGYETFTRVLNVGEETATMSVILEEKTVKDSSKEKEDSKTKGFYLRVNTPVGAEVEIDGNYVGVAPVAIAKEAGSHTIKLTKNGYVTRTYTVVVENTAADSNYSFSDLLPVGTVTSNE
ncbi:MAG: PEGA domain-containing protein, partial [Lachnospiraceae bacterium]|nr:PEGA domain-containing protein [Lachnospiraceae bacterium]